MRRACAAVAGPLAFVLGCSTDAPVDSDTSADSGQACGDLTCEDGLRLTLVAQAGTFAAGSYVITLGAPGLGMQCEIVIADDTATCMGDEACVGSNTCGADVVLSPPPSYAVFFLAGSGSVQVVVARDNDALVDDVIEPSYVELAPNGSDCEPVCLVAEATVSVP